MASGSLTSLEESLRDINDMLSIVPEDESLREMRVKCLETLQQLRQLAFLEAFVGTEGSDGREKESNEDFHSGLHHPHTETLPVSRAQSPLQESAEESLPYLVAGWERHTRGIGSKLMARMRQRTVDGAKPAAAAPPKLILRPLSVGIGAAATEELTVVDDLGASRASRKRARAREEAYEATNRRIRKEEREKAKGAHLPAPKDTKAPALALPRDASLGIFGFLNGSGALKLATPKTSKRPGSSSNYREQRAGASEPSSTRGKSRGVCGMCGGWDHVTDLCPHTRGKRAVRSQGSASGESEDEGNISLKGAF